MVDGQLVDLSIFDLARALMNRLWEDRFLLSDSGGEETI
mgnify:CR=1 FL=1